MADLKSIETACHAMELYSFMRCMLSSGDVPSWAVDDVISVINKMASAYGDNPFKPRADYTRVGNLSPDYLLAQDRARRLEHGATIPLTENAHV